MKFITFVREVGGTLEYSGLLESLRTSESDVEWWTRIRKLNLIKETETHLRRRR